jgi:hypothetical protein
MDVRRAGIPHPSENLKRLERTAREIAGLIGPQCPAGWGFALLFFEFNGGKESSWISNANRADMVKMLREMADKLELDAAGGPVAPFSQ